MMIPSADLLPGESHSVVIDRARLATLVEGAVGGGLILDGALAVRDGCIEWVGHQKDLPGSYLGWRRLSAEGRLVTPALIDCHTHLVFGGSRAHEFELRLQGSSYEEIARSGGGILATVGATRSASREQLIHDAARRARHLLREGVATVEIKSGYGLDLATELEMLRAARAVQREVAGLRVRTTLLAAHAVPPEFAGRADAYISQICEEILPAAVAEDLVDQVDVFCETIAFDLSQAERVLEAAHRAGLTTRIHAEQLSSSGAAALAARLGALSADHLEYLDAAGVHAMAGAGTVAVLLPGAFYTLREDQAPPVEALRRAGVEMAVATDWNPGSSPLGSLLLAMNMACTLLRLTPVEALTGTTRGAARALGLEAQVGTLAPGKLAEVVAWPLQEIAELSYRIAGHDPPDRLVHGAWVSCRDLAQRGSA
jgi:imidazolonepropionase